jgi:hypothetical protein
MDLKVFFLISSIFLNYNRTITVFSENLLTDKNFPEVQAQPAETEIGTQHVHIGCI